ncbi:hypothetical protein GQ53DRAFT_793283 [Thozetella sp. PMI_491]|nr:hypothetical protein GQ53DRAFT_793283 [Thozetella sp. PMI_491]
MAELLLLPSTTYRPPSSQARKRPGALNPIIEEAEETMNTFTSTERRRRARNNRSVEKIEKIEQWLSPLSDHFPTPRGMHFMAAPILPSTPSIADSCEGDDASSEASSSEPSTKMWNRASVNTDVTEFDIYDLSDEEKDRKNQLRSNGIVRRRSSTRSTKRASRASIGSRKALAPLVIPESPEPLSEETFPDIKKSSPVPLSPPSAVALSPAQQSFIESQQAIAIPTISAPPSLDGSLNSEEMAALSAPPTPLMGAQDDDEPWAGVHLQPGALETLQALSSGESDYDDQSSQNENEVPELQHEMSEARQPPRLVTNLPRNNLPFGLSPAPRTLAGLTKLEIPSPGGFFSELSSATRKTWSLGGSTPADDIAPPTSTTAEEFYKTPWSNNHASLPPPPPRPLPITTDPQSAIVERVFELPLKRVDDLPTAFKIQETPITAVKVPYTPGTARMVPPTPRSARMVPPTPGSARMEPGSPLVATEIVEEYDPNYAQKQVQDALSHFDRTELWLMAQRSYLGGVAEFSPEDEEHSRADEKPDVPPKDAAPLPTVVEAEPEVKEAEPKKKTVRFSEAPVSTENFPRSLPSKLSRQESAYYRAFTDYTVRSQPTDVFVSQQPRFEALQAQRISLGEKHRNQLLGKYQLSVVPMSAKKRMSTNVARGDDVVVDDPEKLRADKENDALSQMSMATWHVAATKLLNGGRLIAAPVAKRLARLSRMAPDANGVSHDRARILDLGGQGTCDWAWHVALQYPNTKIYTVTTKAIRQMSNSNIRGPPNHRQVAVERLTKLPFADNQFDLVSARELHAILKLFGENGADEWDQCLAECMRVLKPGGFIEFSVLDADVMNSGPLGHAKAVEFGFDLKTLGYDANPTRSFLGRLERVGFEDVRRAWMCLPIGPRPAVKNFPVARDSTGMPVRTLQLDAIVSGSSDNVAAVTGFAAGWSWERWLLRAEMEKAAGELRLTDTVTPGEAMREAGKMLADVHAIVEEGRKVGSGFRMLRGYAKKPNLGCRLERMGTINVRLDLA